MHVFLFYKQVDFHPQTQVHLFLVAGSKYAYNVLILTHLNFVVLLNNGSSLYIQMKPIVSPVEYDTKGS